MTDIVTMACVIAGALLMLIAAVGIVRLPDVLCRSHAVTKALTLGIFLLLVGLWVHLSEKQTALKIVLAIFFQMATIPVAANLVCLLALQKKLPRWRARPMDDHRKGAAE